MAKSKVEAWLEEMEREAETPEPMGAEATVTLVPASEEALSVLWAPQPSDSGRHKTVEEILQAQGKLESEKLLQARTVQANSRGKKITQILHEMAAVSEEDIQLAVAQMMNLPFEALDPKHLDRRAFDYLPSEFMKARGCCGVRLDDGRLTLGMVDPADIFLLEEVKRRVTVKRFTVVVVCQSHIIAAIEAGHAASSEGEKFDEIIKDMGEEELEIVEEVKEEVTDLAKASGESPVIRLVNFLIFDAIKQGASDIHIEPHEKRLVVRYRIDGVLFEAMNPPAGMHAAVVSRMKIMANLDIAERRLPQDGRIRTMVHGPPRRSAYLHRAHTVRRKNCRAYPGQPLDHARARAAGLFRGHADHPPQAGRSAQRNHSGHRPHRQR